MRRPLLFLLFLAAPVAAVIEFPSTGGGSMCPTCSPITANGNYAGSKVSYDGGVILHVAGVLDGATVALEVNAGGGWIPSDTCAALVTAQVCRAAPGPVSLRVTITGAGATTELRIRGFEAQAVVASTQGSGATTFDLVGAGTNANALIVGTGGTLAVAGTGEISASSVDHDGDGNSALLADGSTIVLDADDDGTPEHTFTATYYQAGSTRFTPGTNAFTIERSTGIDIIAGDTDWITGESGDNGWGLNQVSEIGDGCTIYPRKASSSLCIGAGSLRAGGAAVLIWAADYIESKGCKNFGKLTGLLPTGGAACDMFFDVDVSEWCCFTSSWVQCDDNTTACTA